MKILIAPLMINNSKNIMLNATKFLIRNEIAVIQIRFSGFISRLLKNRIEYFGKR